MTKTFALSATNDFTIGRDGNLVVHEGLLAVQDACLNAAKTQLGEMIYAVDQGVSYFDTVFDGQPNQVQFEISLRKALLAVADVIAVNEILTAVKDNTLYYRATILTSYGQAVIDGNS